MSTIWQDIAYEDLNMARRSQNVLKYGIRDTLIRDTVPQTINREELN